MSAQGEFDFTPRPPAPVGAGEIDRLLAYLEAHPDWISARRLSEALDIADRKIRQLAEHSDGRIVSGPGCPGYRAFKHCTVADLDEVANRLTSQGRSMIKRAIRLRKKAHQALQLSPKTSCL